jgi:hypothetical protein
MLRYCVLIDVLEVVDWQIPLDYAPDDDSNPI